MDCLLDDFAPAACFAVGVACPSAVAAAGAVVESAGWLVLRAEPPDGFHSSDECGPDG